MPRYPLTRVLRHQDSKNVSLTPELTAQYHRSRMFFVLFSALLGVWELVGITLAGPVAGMFDVKHKYLIPWILLACSIYYGYRMVVEWFQSDKVRRSQRVSKFDLGGTFIIAGISFVIFAVQTVTAFEFGDYFRSGEGEEDVYMLAFVSPLPLTLLWGLAMFNRHVKRIDSIIYTSFSLIFVVAAVTSGLAAGDSLDWALVLRNLVAGALSGFAIVGVTLLRLRSHKRIERR